MAGPYSVTQVHGYGGSLKVGSTYVWITEWSADHKNDVKEGTTTQNAGFRSWTKGLESMDGSFKTIWDTLQIPYLIGFVPGLVVALELHVTPTSFYALDGIIVNNNVTHNVQELVTYNTGFHSQGSFTPPTS